MHVCNYDVCDYSKQNCSSQSADFAAATISAIVIETIAAIITLSHVYELQMCLLLLLPSSCKVVGV